MSVEASIRGTSHSIMTRSLLSATPKVGPMMMAKPFKLRLFAGAY
jgi:hypothetical protein